MTEHDLIRSLKEPGSSRIVLVVADGLGGLPPGPGDRTELETAYTPNLDEAARRGVCGLSVPVLPGITPGSGPGHLALFGYDPLHYRIGRGILEALGIDFPIGPDDVAIRGNFCTVDEQGRITDRRAGRPPTELTRSLCQRLAQITIPGVEVFVEPVREHRFVVVFRGKNLGDKVHDTDPQETGVPPLPAVAEDEASRTTAEAANQFIQQAARLLQDQHPANMIVLRGFARRPDIEPMADLYGLNPVAIAVYPMYKGLARLVGMKVVPDCSTLRQQVDTLQNLLNDHDFFFVHFKYTDSTGEDGDFAAKVAKIEEFDAEFGRILAMKPEVLIVTGDHSTPSKLRRHSWHPVPTLLLADTCRTDAVTAFGESDCLRGGLGQFAARHLIWLALAHAERLQKYGA